MRLLSPPLMLLLQLSHQLVLQLLALLLLAAELAGRLWQLPVPQQLLSAQCLGAHLPQVARLVASESLQAPGILAGQLLLDFADCLGAVC